MSKFESALRAIDATHAQDPNLITIPKAGGDGSSSSREEEERPQMPYELHYANKMTRYLSQYDPSASETLRLAVRAQHLRRWEIPRSAYPATRPGYFAWRTFLKARQAQDAERICLDCGYAADEAARVAALVRKDDLKKDAETQALEDVACLVFLDDQFEEFERTLQDEEKMVRILAKTWAKMSPRGHELALQIDMSDRARELVGKALEQ